MRINQTLILCSIIVLTIVGCAPSDPATLRAMASDIERQRARATAAAHAYQAEIEAQYRAATAQAQEQDRLEIERLQASGHATATAIMADQAALDVALARAQATRQAGEYSLSATSTAQAAQATQTALALAIAYEPTRIALSEFRNDIINRGMSLSLVVLMVLLFILAWILIAFVRNWLQWKIEWTDRHKQVLNTVDGVVRFQDGEITLVRDDGNRMRRMVRESRTMGISNAEYLPGATYVISDPAPRVGPDIDLALRLLSRIDDDEIAIPGWRDINWSSSTWQKAIGYLRAFNLVEKNSDGYILRASAREVRYQLTSPTPPGGR